MNWQDASLAMAGLIGGGTAVVHGVLTQRLMVRPIEALVRRGAADVGADQAAGAAAPAFQHDRLAGSAALP